MPLVARILDVNVNRAREALRVLEDAARLALNDAALCGELKSLRHELRRAVDSLPLPAGALEASRDAAGDVGTDISTASEWHRGGLLDVVIAAGKRLTESLRVIEEMCKVAAGERPLPGGEPSGAAGLSHAACETDESGRTGPARWFESLRYRAYDLDAKMQLRFGSGRAAQWRLCLILTQSLCARPWRDVLTAALDGGCDCVQVRGKQLDGGEFVRHVKEVLACARRHSPNGAAVIVNDRVDVALAADADGVHLGQSDLSVHEARRIAGRGLIVGVSTHDLDEARCAIDAGADYCGLGAMFATPLKPLRPPSGIAFLKAFLQRYPDTPHLAIGGITPNNAPALYAAGARGLAVSSAICAADDPGAIVRTLLEGVAHQPSPQRGAHVLPPTSPATAGMRRT